MAPLRQKGNKKMAENRPQTPRDAYGSSYQYSRDGKNGEQIHYNSKGNRVGTSRVGKDGSTYYYDNEGDRIYHTTNK